MAPRFYTLSALVGAWEGAARCDPHRPFIRILRSSPPQSRPTYVCPLSLEWGRTSFGWEATLSRSKALILSNHLMNAMHTDHSGRGDIVPPVRVVVSVTSPMLYVLVVLAAWRGNIPFLPVDVRRQSFAVGTLSELGAEEVVIVDDAFVRDVIGTGFKDTTTPPCGMKRCRSAEVDGNPFKDNDCSHVIFTSGTTGTPKLVHTSRRNMAVYGQAFTRRSHMPLLLDTTSTVSSSPPRILAVSASSFDPSLGDVLAALISGGELILSGGSSVDEIDGTFQGIGGAIAFLTTHADYTHCVSTPAVWTSAAPPMASTSITPRPKVYLGGERMSSQLQRAWAPLVELFNIYGLTEGTIYQSISGPLGVGSDPGRLGTPLDGCDIVKSRTAAAEDTEGEYEVCLEGPMVSKGYVSTNTTEGPFYTTPNNGESGFHTGDWVREGEGGSLRTIVGRRDGMVKINGIRTALEEVEHTTSQCLLTYYCNAHTLYNSHNLEVTKANEVTATKLENIAAIVASAHGSQTKAIVHQHLRALRCGTFLSHDGRPSELGGVTVEGCVASYLGDRGLCVYARLQVPPGGATTQALLQLVHEYNPATLHNAPHGGVLWRLPVPLSTQVFRVMMDKASVPSHHLPRVAILDMEFEEASMGGVELQDIPILPDTLVTPNGKRDRAAVRSWFTSLIETSAVEDVDTGIDLNTKLSGLSQVGRVCLAAWQQALGPEIPITLRSSFVFMGGDSLMAAMVMRGVAIALRPTLDVDTNSGGRWIEGQLPPELSPHLLLTSPTYALSSFITYMEGIFGNVGVAEVEEEGEVPNHKDVASATTPPSHDPLVSLTRETIQQRQYVLLDMMLASGVVTIDSSATSTLLHLAVALDDPISSTILLHHGSKVTSVNEHNMTPAFLAAEGKLRCLRLFVAKSLPVAVRDRRCQGLLHAAARKGAEDVVRYCMITLKLDPCTRDCWQRMPIHWAIINGHVGTVNTILSYYEGLGTTIPPQCPKAHWAKLAGKTTHATYLTPLEMLDSNTEVSFGPSTRERLATLNLT